MKNDNAQANRRRGSSPPFQDPEQDYYEWLNGLKSIGQRDEKTPEMRGTGQPGNERTKSTDLRDDPLWINGPNPGHQSFDGGDAQQEMDDKSRWQDDGGESGEEV